jgi:hypothetical protein
MCDHHSGCEPVLIMCSIVSPGTDIFRRDTPQLGNARDRQGPAATIAVSGMTRVLSDLRCDRPGGTTHRGAHRGARRGIAQPVMTRCPDPDHSTGMTVVRIADVKPWPGKNQGGRGFRISSFLVVLADDLRAGHGADIAPRSLRPHTPRGTAWVAGYVATTLWLPFIA